jgi:hypothetical protein
MENLVTRHLRGAQSRQLTITLPHASIPELKRPETAGIVDSTSIEPSAPLSASVRQPQGWPHVPLEHVTADGPGLETRYGFSPGQCPPLDHNDPSQLVRMMGAYHSSERPFNGLIYTSGYLVANQAEDSLFLADVCERTGLNDINRKEAAKALRRELK